MLRKNYRVCVVLLIIICFLYALMVWGIFSSTPRMDKEPIYYISQEEILSLEEERVGTSGEALFCGKNQEVFLQIDEFIKDYKKQGKSIFLREGKILGKQAFSVISGNQPLSLSKEVYMQILNKLQSDEACQEIKNY